MHTYLLHARRVCLQHGMVSVAAILVLLLIPLHLVRAQGTLGSNTSLSPLGQTKSSST